MAFSTPLETILQVLDARARKDVAMAVACYEQDATVVAEPGKQASGERAVKRFIQATLELPITFAERTIIQTADIALHISHWTLRPAGSPQISGRTTDVLHRQPDGRWLIAIDNPWGTSVLDRSMPLGGSPA